MASGILQKFLKKHSPLPLRLLTNFNNPQLLNPSSLHHNHLTVPKPQTPNTQNTFLPSLNADRINSSQHFYPSFSIGYFLHPISQYGVDDQSGEADDKAVGAGDDAMWADSVKKKRKRKMNKHKYRKLRKRLRRKT